MIRRLTSPLSLHRASALTVLALVASACADPYTPPEFASVEIASGNQQVGKVCTVMSQPLVVTAFKQTGEKMPGARVHFSAAVGTIDVGSPITAADGTARVNYTMGTTPGPMTVEVLGLTAGEETRLTFNLTAEPNPPNVLRRISGNAQTGVAGATLPTSLLARVNNTCGVATPGVSLSWATTAGILESATTVTDSIGNSTNKLTLPSTAGPVTVTASAPGYTAITFTATATAPVVP